MLKPELQPNRKLASMTAEQRGAYQRAVAEEMATKSENMAAASAVAKRLKDERKIIAELVAKLRQAREQAGVSLSEMESRTGITKSSLSRLENSTAPNPTLITLNRYATAIGVTLTHTIT